MGRRSRHTSRTGDGGAEVRQRKKQLNAANKDYEEKELEFFDDPSEDENMQDSGSDSASEDDLEETGIPLNDEPDSDGDDVEEELQQVERMKNKWGSSKRNYYSADTAEYELDEDEDAAQDEEEAAVELQKQQAERMGEEDFELDDSDESEEEEEEEEEEQPNAHDEEDWVGQQLADLDVDGSAPSTSVEELPKDYSKLSKQEKLQLVNQSAPELLGLQNELEKSIKTLQNDVSPNVKQLELKDGSSRRFHTVLDYYQTKQKLLLNYVSNISFYLLLRAEGKSVSDHQVMHHLLQSRNVLAKLDDVASIIEPQLEHVLSEEDDGLDQFIRPAKKTSEQAPAKTSAKPTKGGISDKEQEEAAAFYQAAKKQKEAYKQAKEEYYTREADIASSSDSEEEGEGKKRGASQQIIKNRGLVAHKSKKNRNPRTKKREQWRRAQIRRKGQVRDVRTGEAASYGGETTGIKANLSRSRKIGS